LEIENRALKSNSILRNDTRLDLSKLYVGQKPHDKMGIGFKEFSSPSTSKSTIISKEKEEHTQNSNITYQNNKNAQINERSQKHAFRYRYNYKRHKNHKNYHYNNIIIINPHLSNKIYFKGQMVGFMNSKVKIYYKNGLKGMSQKELLLDIIMGQTQEVTKINSQIILTSELKN
jgi:hypothetical protein